MRRHHDNPEDMKVLLSRLAKEEYCYVTTTGRVSRRPHKIEIWFGLNSGTIYLLSGGMDRSDWVKNLLKNPSESVLKVKLTPI